MEERHFALVGISCHTNQGSLAISFRSGTQSDPSISSVAYAIMIPTPLQKEEFELGRPIIYVGDLLHTMRMSGLSHVRTETL